MKRILFLFLMVCALNANAQNFLINFAGTGASTTVNTIKVGNLTKGTYLTLNGNDILGLTTPTTISEPGSENSLRMKIYPNPITDESKMLVHPPVEGDAIISIYEMTGRPIIQIQSSLESSQQEFLISGLKQGLYLVSVKGKTYQYSKIMISNGKSNRAASIHKSSSNIHTIDNKVLKIDTKGIQENVDMDYTTGDILKFTGISGNYSTVVTAKIEADTTITFNFVACTDVVNNYYPVVKIGTQLWMAENLKTTKYNNGDLIGTTTPATLNITDENAPKYQWAYAGDESNVATYGRMYTWHAVTDIRGVCPAGWHIPTDAEWTILTIYSGGEGVASAKLKESGLEHWFFPNSGATNETGFTALPGGFRTSDGIFTGISHYGTWWGSTLHTQTGSYGRGMTYNGVDFGYTYGPNEQKSGFSVRCLKDN